jgi:hypothetical protein
MPNHPGRSPPGPRSASCSRRTTLSADRGHFDVAQITTLTSLLSYWHILTQATVREYDHLFCKVQVCYGKCARDRFAADEWVWPSRVRGMLPEVLTPPQPLDWCRLEMRGRAEPW